MPEEIPRAVARGGEKLEEKVKALAERIRLNRTLVALKEDVPLARGPGDLARRPVDTERARALFTELEFGRLLRDLPAPTPSAEARVATGVVATRAELDAAVAEARRAGQVGMRAAFSSSLPRRYPPAGLALAAGERSWYVPLGHRYLGAPVQLSRSEAAAALRPLLEDPSVEVHTHDLKSEIHALRHLGLSAPVRGIDTDLASRLLLTVTPRACARRRGARAPGRRDSPGARRRGEGRRRPGHLPGGGDGRACRCRRGASFPAWPPPWSARWSDEGLARLHDEIERPLVPVLAGMERAGIAVDPRRWASMSTEFGAAMDDLESRIHAAAGHPFNVASTRELAQVLFDELELPVVKRLKTGPSTDQDVLEKLAEEHPLPRLVLEHRSLSKLKGTYVDALPLLVDPADGRIHTTFNQAGAATGRLSSQDPNLQNIPVRTELSRRIRAAFVAPPGQPAGLRRLLADRAAHPGPLRRATRRSSSPSATGRTSTPAPRPRPSACRAGR